MAQTDRKTSQDLLAKYGLKPYCISGIGEGWIPLVERLIIKLKALGWDGKIAQVKEKFGGLRFYIETGTDEMHDAIDAAEAESFTICENCGAPGRAREGGWILTLCDDCDKDRSWK